MYIEMNAYILHKLYYVWNQFNGVYLQSKWTVWLGC